MTAAGVNDKERPRLLDQWERITFRIFGLFGNDSRTKVGDYVRLAYKIVTEDIETRTYNQIMAGLRELGQEHPVDQAVEQGLIRKDFYDRPEECRYLLWSYEEHLAQKLGSGATIDENERMGIWRLRAADSIEHIFPRNPNVGEPWRSKMRSPDGSEQSLEANVDRIGNLLLLPVKVNQEADSPFDEKKVTYAKHNLRMVHEVCENSDWTFSEIETRETRIVDWAKTRWCDV